MVTDILIDPTGAWHVQWANAHGAVHSLLPAEPPKPKPPQPLPADDQIPSGRSADEVAQALQRVAEAVVNQDHQIRQSSVLSQDFLPVWEVDQFQWPTTLNLLIDKLGMDLVHTGRDLQEAAQAGMKVLGVTSVSDQAGRSTTAMCLARAAAAAGTTCGPGRW